jgi:hypothetical protein
VSKIDPATAKIIIQIVIQSLKDEETRKRLLMVILAPVVTTLLLITLIFYLLTSPIEALGALFNNDEHTQYVNDLQTNYGFYGDGAVIDITGEYRESEMPLFIQWDNRWGMYPYGRSGTIASSACGPTSMAMIVVAFTGKTNVNPKTMADWSVAHGHRVEGVGTAWSFFPDAAQSYGFNCSQLSVNASDISNSLRNNKPVIASMGPGHFTRGGHFIVLRGITSDGKILVNDPNSREKSEKAWDISIIVNEAKAAWSFYK